jgi:hypothetical protein
MLRLKINKRRKEMKFQKQSTTTGADVWYILGNIATLGAWYFLKIVIKKAIVEAHNSMEQK